MIDWPQNAPTLVDGDLVLRPWAASDAPFVLDACQDQAIQKWTTIPVPYQLENALDFVSSRQRMCQEQTAISWIGVLRGEPVLSVGIHGIAHFDHSGQIGYWVAPQGRGERLASRAVDLVTKWAFGVGFRRIDAIADPDNRASQAVLFRAGYELETVLRNRLTRRDGTQVEAIQFVRCPS